MHRKMTWLLTQSSNPPSHPKNSKLLSLSFHLMLKQMKILQRDLTVIFLTILNAPLSHFNSVVSAESMKTGSGSSPGPVYPVSHVLKVFSKTDGGSE